MAQLEVDALQGDLQAIRDELHATNRILAIQGFLDIPLESRDQYLDILQKILVDDHPRFAGFSRKPVDPLVALLKKL